MMKINKKREAREESQEKRSNMIDDLPASRQVYDFRLLLPNG